MLSSPTCGAFAVLLAFAPLLASAQSVNESTDTQLPTVNVTASGNVPTGFKARLAQVNKSDAPLAETPQSITVVTRAMLDSQQAVTVADALKNVPGVVSGQFGWRGWDDFIIRGQVALDSLYLDGLRTNGYPLPGYVLADAGVAYNAERWRAALNVKNLFNTQYYTGGLARAVALGDDRTVMLTLGYRY